MALLAVTACGKQSDQIGVGGSSTTVFSMSNTPATIAPPTSVVESPEDLPADFQPLPPSQVEAKALSEDYTDRRVWSSPDGKTLRLIGVARDACAGVEAEVLEASATTIRIALRPMAQPQGGPEGQMCAMVLTPKTVVVPLREALGKRTVVVVEG